MSTISDPSNAVTRLAHLLTDSEDPDDLGMLAEFGEEILVVARAIAAKVRQTNKACKGSATLKLNLHGYRTKNKEVAIEIEPDLTSKKPNMARKRGAQVYAGHEGELSTQAIQEEMPLFTKDTAKAIDGGKDDQGKKAKAI